MEEEKVSSVPRKSVNFDPETLQPPTACSPWNNKLPCAKFIIAAGISVASFTIGCTMVIISPPNSAMLPFYSSLITGAISYWVQPPSMSEKKN